MGFYDHPRGFGGKGIRTPGLLIANETLYQLSYTPKKKGKLSLRTIFQQAIPKIRQAHLLVGPNSKCVNVE
jgi:hypothetical protein